MALRLYILGGQHHTCICYNLCLSYCISLRNPSWLHMAIELRSKLLTRPHKALHEMTLLTYLTIAVWRPSCPLSSSTVAHHGTFWTPHACSCFWVVTFALCPCTNALASGCCMAAQVSPLQRDLLWSRFIFYVVFLNTLNDPVYLFRNKFRNWLSDHPKRAQSPWEEACFHPTYHCIPKA